jgi:Protein of unknown function (DUF2752)
MNTVPPKISRPITRWAWIFLATGGLLALALVFFINPSTHHFYPVCHFHQLTGLYCPGCGMTRSLYALLHGDFLMALRDNALFIGGIFFFMARGGWLLLNHRIGKTKAAFFPLTWLWPLLALVLIFTVLRNLPTFSFLAPV